MQTSPGLRVLGSLQEGGGCHWDSVSGLIPGDAISTALSFGSLVPPLSQLPYWLGGMEIWMGPVWPRGTSLLLVSGSRGHLLPL